jgi:RNA-binding protein YlmH
MSAERDELIRRGEDLARRCEQKSCLTKSGFLTPAERHALEHAPGLRGAGKGRIAELGGSSRKGRLFVTAEVYR